MTKIFRLGLSGLVLGLLSACAGAPAPPLNIIDENMGMIFGHIESYDMMTKVEIREYGRSYFPPFSIPPKVYIYPNGDFIAVNLKPADYYVSYYVSKQNTRFTLNAIKLHSYQDVYKVKPGKMVYAGSYRITGRRARDKTADKDEFYYAKVMLPSEREILRRLHKKTQDRSWQAWIDRRLRELRI